MSNDGANIGDKFHGQLVDAITNKIVGDSRIGMIKELLEKIRRKHEEKNGKS